VSVDHLVEVDLGDLVGNVAPGRLGDLVPDAPLRQELHNVEQVLLLPLLRLLRHRLRRRRRTLRRGAGAQGSLRWWRRKPEGAPEQAHRPLRHGHLELKGVGETACGQQTNDEPLGKGEGGRELRRVSRGGGGGNRGLGFCVGFPETGTEVGLDRSGPRTA
jgi:hypothetical protein